MTRHYVFYVIFAYIFRDASAFQDDPIDYDYDQNPSPPDQPSSNIARDTVSTKPGEMLGKFLGNLLISAANSDYNYPALPDNRHDVNTGIGTGYNAQLHPEDEYSPPLYDNDVQTANLNYNKQYDREGYTNDNRFATNNIVSHIIPSNPDRTLNAEKWSYNSRVDETRASVVDDRPSNGYNYQSPTTDQNISSRFQTDTDFNENVNAISSAGSRSDYRPRTVEYMPQEKLTQHNKPITEIKEESTTFKSGTIPNNNNRNDSNTDKTLKILKVKEFIYQAQPVRPENERTKDPITLYYLE